MSRLGTGAEVIHLANDTVVEVRGLMNEVSGDVLNSATVTATLKDAAGVAVTGASSLAMSYVTGSTGVYRVTLPYTLSLSPNGRYTLHIDANAGSGQRAHWEIPIVAKVRSA